VRIKDGCYHLDGAELAITMTDLGRASDTYQVTLISGEWPAQDKLADFIDIANYGGRYNNTDRADVRILTVHTD
jgi:hypothetical protein